MNLTVQLFKKRGKGGRRKGGGLNPPVVIGSNAVVI